MNYNHHEAELTMAKYGVPAHLHGGLARYIFDGIRPGDFLAAVLSNDLREAFGRADKDSRAGLFELVKFLYNEVPGACWGSKESYEKWGGLNANR